MRDAVLEGEGVDEGFRAEPGERSASVMSMAPERSRLAIGDCRPGQAPRRCRCRSTRIAAESFGSRRSRRSRARRFECGLLASIDGQPMRPGAGSPERRLGRVGGDRREGRRPAGRGSALAATASADVEDPWPKRHRGRDCGPGAPPREAVRPARLGRLRQRDEERLPRRRASARARSSEARGAGAFEIAAVRREREVEPQDLGLRQPPLQLRRPARSGAVSRSRSARSAARGGAPPAWSRRTARDDAALPQELCAGTGERPQVDAAMLLEAVILVRLQQGKEMWIDICRLDRQPPSPVHRGEAGGDGRGRARRPNGPQPRRDRAVRGLAGERGRAPRRRHRGSRSRALPRPASPAQSPEGRRRPPPSRPRRRRHFDRAEGRPSEALRRVHVLEEPADGCIGPAPPHARCTPR